MQSYHLTDEFTDVEAEQSLLASLMQSPGLYWDLLDLLTPDVFSQETPTWQALTLALETGQGAGELQCYQRPRQPPQARSGLSDAVLYPGESSHPVPRG